MGLIPEDVIREIRERSDIVAVIGQHVTLRKAGHNHKGLCPFHNEKTPSFNVNGDKGFFYCFGCQKKGDVFTFLMEYDGKSFTEAAETLAAMCGIEVPRVEEPAEARERRSERATMLELNKLATEHYRALLGSPRGEAGRAYLTERGIGDEVAARFQLGFAPDAWSSLAEHLERTGADLELAGRIGLVAPRKNGGHYDRFRNRLMCPVAVPGGDVVGFSGRLLPGDDEMAKYINSPESPVYKKSKLLYGLQLAREAFRTKGRAILVEGNFDVISLHQAGFDETVAPLGTALTEDQTGLLKRFADRVVLLYDADKAGHAAALKALGALMAADLEVYIAVLPPGDDPDSLVKRDGAETLAKLLDRAQLAVDYFAHEVFSKTVRSAHGRARTLEAAAGIARSVRDPIKRNLIVDTLALGMNVPGQLVWRAIGGHAGTHPTTRQPDAPGPAARHAPPPREELDLLAILADHPHLIETAEENDVFSLLTDARLQDMYCAARQGTPVIAALPDDASPVVAQHVLSGAFASVKDPHHALLEAMASLRRLRNRARLAELQRRAEVAKRRGDAELERELVREILSTLNPRGTRQVD